MNCILMLGMYLRGMMFMSSGLMEIWRALMMYWLEIEPMRIMDLRRLCMLMSTKMAGPKVRMDPIELIIVIRVTAE